MMKYLVLVPGECAQRSSESLGNYWLCHKYQPREIFWSGCRFIVLYWLGQSLNDGLV